MPASSSATERTQPASTRTAAAIRSTSSSSRARATVPTLRPRPTSLRSPVSMFRLRSPPRSPKSSRLLSKPARLILEGAAVAGDPFDPELAAAAAGASDAAAVEALDELLRLDLIRPTDVPRRFRFRHPLVRHAVYESMPGGWRLGAHERCADALALRGSLPATIAHSRRTLRSSGRRGRNRATARSRRSSGPPRTCQRGTLVRRRPSSPSTNCSR